MGSIINRNGRWRVQIRRVGHRAQCKTFDTKAQAERWERQMEGDIDAGRSGGMLGALTVGDVIKAYRGLRDQARPISDSSNEHYMLKALEAGLGAVRLAVLKPEHIVGYATRRRDDGAGPYTVNMDISKLGTAMRYGAAALGIAPPDVVGAARPMLSHLRLIGGGGKRERRPTDDELQRVVDYLRENRGEVFAEAVLFAVASAMRRGEIVGLRWADIDEATRIAKVMRKHPRKGKVLERVPLLPPAWEILQRQPKGDGPIFPTTETTLSKYFTWACADLGIVDLHLHDMRHEGTSRLFEEGLTIERVALVTGHKDWRHLKRYTNLRPEDLTRPSLESGPDKPQRRGSRPAGASPRGRSSPGKPRR
jgi:integrase